MNANIVNAVRQTLNTWEKQRQQQYKISPNRRENINVFSQSITRFCSGL